MDIDGAVKPDVIAELTDLSPIESGSIDAVWASHCVEHLYAHQVARALAEFHRILRDDGFACITVPDLQTVAQYVAADRLQEPIYHSAAGPISAHDMLFGHGAAVAGGRTSMAHRCGFTPSSLVQLINESSFPNGLIQRHADKLELVALAVKVHPWSEPDRARLVAALAA